MATSAVARETVFALRQKIAKIEGRLAERLVPAASGAGAASGAMAAGVVLRRGVAAARADGFWLQTGVEPLDRALGGGLPRAALTEIVGAETRDAGASIGFALALVGRFARTADRGRRGRAAAVDRHRRDFPRGRLRLCARHRRARRHRPAIAAVLRSPAARRRALDRRGGRRQQGAVGGGARNPRQSRKARSHRDAAAAPAGRAGRQAGLPAAPGGLAEPTAAPVRLLVAPAPAGLRRTLAGPLPARSGRPPSSSRSARAARPCRDNSRGVERR